MSVKQELVAGIDIGTTFFKVGLFDRLGRCAGQGRRAFEKDQSYGGRCEAPADRFRKILRDTLDDAIASSGCGCHDIRAVSYGAQANSFLLLDDHSDPLTPIIIWQDGRADPVPGRVLEFWKQEQFFKATGLGLTGHEWMAAKLDWFRREQPETWARCRRVMTLSDYLVFLATGRHAGDSGTASLLGLWDLTTMGWYRPALDFFGLSEEQLPELHRPGTGVLELSKAGAEWLGLEKGIPFTVGALDHHTAALGAGIGTVAPVSVSFGTSLVCFRFMDRYEPRRGCCMGPATDEGRFYQISFTSPGTTAMDDYRSRYAAGKSYDELFLAAERVKQGADGLTANIAGGALQFSGRTDAHGEGHCVRAVMELTGRSLAGLLGDLSMDEAFRKRPVILAAGGGARSRLWMRVVAETAGVEVVPANPPDTAAKGAAMFAAVAGGWFSGLSECAAEWCSHNDFVTK